jgi:hypothetical protein
MILRVIGDDTRLGAKVKKEEKEAKETATQG